MDPYRSISGRLTSLAVLTVIVSCLVLSCGPLEQVPASHRPALIFDPSVGSDLQALAQQTWDQFLQVFAARTGCFGDVHVRVAWALDSRGGYDPPTAMVTVLVPGTPARLQSALIHEWAHHIEFQCPEQQELRAAFLKAQGLPADTLWRPEDVPPGIPASDWAKMPSEQFAEATVELVLGGRSIGTSANVTREAVQVIREWANGD
jgi:hypothetical protein